MSKLARVLTVGVMLAATTLGSMTTVAFANGGPIESTVTQDGRRPSTERRVGEPSHHRRAPQQQATTDATIRAALAQERYHGTWSYGDPAIQQALARERHYSTWGYGDTSTPAPAKPSGQPDWLVPGLGVLAAARRCPQCWPCWPPSGHAAGCGSARQPDTPQPAPPDGAAAPTRQPHRLVGGGLAASLSFLPAFVRYTAVLWRVTDVKHPQDSEGHCGPWTAGLRRPIVRVSRDTAR